MKRILFLIAHFSFLICSMGAQSFPLEGGTTSDGITVTKPVLKYFTRVQDKNVYQVDNNYSSPSIKFTVTVPDGKQAVLKYKFFFNISSTLAGGGKIEGSKINFKANIGRTPQKTHTDPTNLCYQADEITIPGGTHNILLEVKFSGKDCQYSGTIDSLSIHIHQFSLKEQAREPLCGEKSYSTYRCDICNKDSLVTVYAKNDEHSMQPLASMKTSCMSNVGKVEKCEYCPKINIVHDGQLKEHDFNNDNTCKVCGLHMPKSRENGSVYEIYDASEMRVLAEMLSLGKVSGNIGIDIKADLEFSSNMPMMPLGTSDHPFQGVLNGNGHRIRGVIGCYQSADCLGFVGVAKGTLQSHAVIANLVFDGGNTLDGAACVGGIVGYATDCDILNCASFGTLGGTNNVGGIVGYADLQVSIHHCASVSTIRTNGKWNPMVCGMPNGHILNSYGAATNSLNGSLDSLSTTTLRHCFSTYGSGNGITSVSQDVLSSYSMIELLKQQSETSYFVMSETDHYPIPIVNTAITARTNRSLAPPQRADLRRAASSVADNDSPSEKDTEIEVIGRSAAENSIVQYFHTPDEVMRQNSILYPDLNCLYVVSRSVPERTQLYQPVSGGDLLALESYIFPDDSSYVKLREYNLVSPTQVKAVAETVDYYTGSNERIDEYVIDNDTYTLKSRISFVSPYDIVYEENVGGALKPVWTIETTFDDAGRATSTNGFSHNYVTGETRLEYSCSYDNSGNGATTGDDGYTEYIDSQTNTLHLIYNYPLSPDEPAMREHFILRATDQWLLETRTEEMNGNEPQLVDGLYFIYNDEGSLEQAVAFAPTDNGGDVRPFMYYEYVGNWQLNPFLTTAIQIPSMKQPSLKQRMDYNVYDMQGRVVSRVTDVQNPFSGLPRGIYIYQGTKYIKK